ncbi:12652_t:CDS:2, partial [Funneliformis geosporum]
MQQQNIISSSCSATPTKFTHNFFSQHIKLISLILIFLSVLIVAPPVPSLSSVFQSFANYSAAAYCKAPLDNWDCGEVCQANAGTKVVKVFENKDLHTKGFIAKDESEKLIVVSYRGTIPFDFKNIITDIKYFKKDYIIPNTRVHLGFYDAFLAIQPQVTDDLIKLHEANPDFRIGFMGHSLGGALAAFSALDFIQQVPALANKNEQVFLSTFGQPRVGDKEFAKYAGDNLITKRTIVKGDPIPRLPPKFPVPLFNGFYEHFGSEIYIDKPDTDPNSFIELENAEDPKGSESVFPIFLKLKSHTGPYFGGVTMKDCDKKANGQ